MLKLDFSPKKCLSMVTFAATRFDDKPVAQKLSSTNPTFMTGHSTVDDKVKRERRQNSIFIFPRISLGHLSGQEKKKVT